MASRSSAFGTLSAALLIAISAASPAIAQDTPEDPVTQDTVTEGQAQQPTELETVTVLAPRVTYRTTRAGDSVLPTTLEIAEKTATVNYGDLDLTRTADLYTLEERVAEAAARICEQLADQFPDGTPSTPDCTRRATDDAMTRVRMTARQAFGRP